MTHPRMVKEELDIDAILETGQESELQAVLNNLRSHYLKHFWLSLA